MPIVDLDEMKKQEAKKKSDEHLIEAIRIGDKTYFKGKYIEDHFDDYGECEAANSDFKRKQDLKKLGLNEHGQSPEAVERSKKIHGLLAERAELLEDVKKIDLKIGQLKRPEAEAPVKEKKKSASKD